MRFYKERVCLNVLAGSIKNAEEIYLAAEKFVVVGVLSKKYTNTSEAIESMQKYSDVLEGNLSIGLGSGDPRQSFIVSEISEKVKANHLNQVFTGVGYARGKSKTDSFINALVKPTDNPNKVIISTGPLSSDGEQAIVSVEVAIKMIKDMGGDSLKLFSIDGLKYRESIKKVAEVCAKNSFALEPTGGITLSNYEEILRIILDSNVKKVIPHIYSSIIDENGNTNIEDVKTLLQITKKVVDSYENN